MNIKTLALASSILAAGAGMAHAEQQKDQIQITPYSHDEHWQVSSDPSMGGCLMQATYGSTMVRFGVRHNTGQQPVGYMMLVNSNWASLMDGQNYSVQVKFEDVGKNAWVTWNGVAHKMGDATFTALEFDFSDMTVWHSIGNASAVHLVYQGRAILDGNLPGAGEAAQALAKCQSAYDGVPATSADPFKGTAPPPPAPVQRDPFVGA
jgi:hypothetical protein